MSDFEFESDTELEEWFDRADLAEFRLEQALEVEIDRDVLFAVEAPWAVAFSGSAASTTSGRIDSTAELAVC